MSDKFFKISSRCKKHIAVIAIVGFSLVVVFTIGSYFFVRANDSSLKNDEINALTIYAWWTSPSETLALNSLVKLFSTKYPNTTVLPSSVVGGAGYSFLRTIKPLVVSGNPPDTFQMHAGYEGVAYINAGLLEPVDDIWADAGLEKVVPQTIREMSRYNGHYYSVPVNIHRANLIWYNQTLLSKYNINPDLLTDWDKFFSACDVLRASGVQYPIALAEGWTASQVFEQIVAGLGVQVYEDWINGKIIDPNDARLISALEIYKKYLEYINPDHKLLAWDTAISRVIDGKSAFSLMGDWANGEFAVANLKYDVDYGVIKAPKTLDSYSVVIDTFQRPKNILHPTSATRWLKLIASKDGQETFNTIKGSISPRTDLDSNIYNTYSQSANEEFKNAKYIFPSVVHGLATPEVFKIYLEDEIVDFFDHKDIKKTAEAIAIFTAQINDQFIYKWALK